jgi:hypothetical protein
MRALALVGIAGWAVWAGWAGGLAAADENVVRVGRADLGGLVWLASGSCGADPLWSRQCRALRVARTAALRGKTLVARGDAGALAQAGGAVVVRGCLACAAPIAGAFVATRGGIELAGDADDVTVIGPELGRVRRVEPLPVGARVDLYFTLAGVETWTQGGARGLSVEPVGWRAYEPCRGETVAASPATPSDEHDDRSGCGPAARAEAPFGPDLPAQPSAELIKAAMDAVAPEVAACYERYGVAGTADVALEIDADGTVAYAGARGAFAGTPTGACLAAAVKNARFPRFERGPMKLHVPFVLR